MIRSGAELFELAHPSAQQVGQMALASAEALADQAPLDFDAVGIHMQAFPRLLDARILTDEAFDNLSDPAKVAIHETALASHGYLKETGQMSLVRDAIRTWYPGGPTRQQRASALTDIMDLHLVSIATAQTEGGLGRIRYNEAGIRSVLRVFGNNLGPFIESFADVETTDVYAKHLAIQEAAFRIASSSASVLH